MVLTLVDDFIRLCEIESPSGSERPVADALADDLRAIGLEVEEDDSGGETGSNAGNLLARIPAPESARTILLCAHMDTVPLTGAIEVVDRDGVLENRHEAILGADNKAAVVVLVELARRLVREGSPVGVELLFTTCEEPGLRGAKAFDQSRLTAEYGFVFDHASPIGEVVVAAPTHYMVEARLHGAPAHAGIRPEDGRNAIAAAAAALARLEFGRLDDKTTANVGEIEGGTAGNVVAERCRVVLETRSLEDGRAADVARRIVDAFTEAASDANCDLETLVQEHFRAYSLARTSAPVALAAAALEARGIEPRFISTGGGSDAHVFNARGLPCVNVANGTKHNHQPDESVTVEALETMLDVVAEMVRLAA
ncbi:MAG: M20/M25/M40 family metallo-hydrolase [Thermoleophilaceae bacterium]